MSRKRKDRQAATPRGPSEREAEVRIIGGKFRGRRLQYHGDPVVRPMKHRTREAIFNLITTECAGRHAIDLFAGTGALGLEALSRGAPSATLIEKHVPTARVIEQNVRALDVKDQTALLVTSAFLWAKRDLPNVEQTFLSVDPDATGRGTLLTDKTVRPTEYPPGDLPWLVFCSPPYAFYNERQAEMLELIRSVRKYAPPGSILVIEADEQFDFQLLHEPESMAAGSWDVRSYAPATVGVWRI